MLPENQINNNPADDATETISVNDDEIVEVEDAQGDVNQAAKLPPRGIYPFKWKAGKDEHPYKSVSAGDVPRSFVGTSLVGSLQDSGGEFEGTLVFENHINSLSKRGKTTSDLHHFLNVVGNPAPNRTTIGELLQFSKDVLESEPIGEAEIDWKASYKSGKKTKTGKDEWVDVVKTMTAFPKHYVDSEGNDSTKAEGGKWDGTYLQQVPNPLDGEPINAQLYVRQYLTNTEARKLQAKSA